MNDNGFKLVMERNRRYTAQTITDADYTDDIALPANTPAQAEILLHSLERAAVGIGLHVNADKTEYMCFNQRGDISTLNGSFLKLMYKFTYLGSSVSSTENDINTQLAKARAANDGLSVIWKSDLTDRIKHSFFQTNPAIWMLYVDPVKTYREKARRQLHKNTTSNIEQVQEATLHKTAAIRPPTSHHENYPS